MGSSKSLHGFWGGPNYFLIAWGAYFRRAIAATVNLYSQARHKSKLYCAQMVALSAKLLAPPPKADLGIANLSSVNNDSSRHTLLSIG